uniref:Uncharacterized protein n=1 Tax=Arundo donax TaxID=35708 RepID=A0A0A9A8E5_ARUDO
MIWPYCVNSLRGLLREV